LGRDFIELLAVLAEERRHGIGTLLLHHTVEMSSTDRVFTSTNQSNLPMIRLLEKAGWRFSGQLQGIDEGDPELVYFKDSSSSQHTVTFLNPESPT
jgi:GNAT superfamily N-acetyltransferase